MQQENKESQQMFYLREWAKNLTEPLIIEKTIFILITTGSRKTNLSF